MNTFSLLIDGMKVEGQGKPFAVLNPATREVAALCPAASLAQLDQAVDSARAAFREWQYCPDEQRSALINAIADTLEQHSEELAMLIVTEQGKPMDLARFELGGAIAWTRATAAMVLEDEVLEDSDAKRVTMHYKPLGVVGSITPWNWPLMIAIWHIIPALKTGNTLVCKPSELTPLSTMRMVELISPLLPHGVINLVCGGAELGAAMAGHVGINKLAFTGSIPTGQAIMRTAARDLKRLTLELGGNDAGIVLADADVSEIAMGIFQGAFINMGQTCAALKRLYVHESLHDALIAKLVELAESQVVGNGMKPGVTFGPIQNQKQFERICALVDDAKARGATVHCGGTPLQGPGYFYPPTLVSGLTQGSPLVDEEQFGPVLPIIRYRDLDDAIAQANANVCGLGGSVWGKDPQQLAATANRLQCGTVWFNSHAQVAPNAPFGGCKLSGIGVAFGIEGLKEFVQPQVIHTFK
ncbi:aldehyde dehydrogenase family protein [Shewanella sedimentimangrovi]|uniref:Aldehyde dehydrogenase family protein n=1 Tax=Shewanella sedimentimangrovi TaxID=2814293 RepID=A0ABX7R2P0_9GAMM|nr:aldehyde dehydrogenase family protein [Shewanella sedimentimangrovi]QSX37333.1 aldehyde dehydrogenase family protein [Shewanella sedimentimangrovi]